MKVKKAGHVHRFGQQCRVCVVNHPEAHKESKRRTRRQRKKGLPAFTIEQWKEAHFAKMTTRN